MSKSYNQLAGKIVLVRHGQTAWALSGQHTGRTDIPLTEKGIEQAKTLQTPIREYNFYQDRLFDSNRVFVSPLIRAQQTAQIAGVADYQVDTCLAEWDYGRVEGYTRAEISKLIGHEYSLWEDGTAIDTSSLLPPQRATALDGGLVPISTLPGETLESVGARTRRLIAKIEPIILEGKDVLLVAHSHALRILAANWLGLDSKFGQNLILDTASISELTVYNGGIRAINKWNRVNY